jgi:D-serine deaminase-like pyridoxal phosphate-dependent protein
MLSNLERMVHKAKEAGAELIPHFKTHQSRDIAQIVSAFGVTKIATSSVKMAQYFAAEGAWTDITVAFPFNPLEIEAINELLVGCDTRTGGKKVDLTLLVTELSTVEMLSAKLAGNVRVMIELDAGQGRSGVPVEDRSTIKKLAHAIHKSNQLTLHGLYCHPGHTYQAESTDEIRGIWKDTKAKVTDLKAFLCRDLGLKEGHGSALRIRMGDTPGCSVLESEALKGIDEIGPGNFIFYDLVMKHLGVCEEEDIAVAVACPIVSKKAHAKQLVLHGGAVHFSKDHLVLGSGDEDEEEGKQKAKKSFGELVLLNADGKEGFHWSKAVPGAKLVSISQEHGILEVDEETLQGLDVGDVVGILPVHSCLTANLMKSYLTLQGGHVYKHAEAVVEPL